MAHRDTKRKNLRAHFTNVVGVLHKHQVPQTHSTTTLAHKVVKLLRKVNQEKGTNFQVLFTSH
jgi:hypothetical protein